MGRLIKGRRSRGSGDRESMGIQKALAPITGTVTGTIERGDVVSVEFSGNASATTSVKPRRTGVIPIASTINESLRSFTIDGTTLTVTVSGNTTGTVTFWAF